MKTSGTYYLQRPSKLPGTNWSRAHLSPSPFPPLPTNWALFETRELKFLGRQSKTFKLTLSIGQHKDHGGFIQVPTPLAYDLIRNTNVGPATSNAYMVSFYHQLHSLRDLQRQYVDLATAPNKLATSLAGLHHAEHCFNYIRQGIHVCGGYGAGGPRSRAGGGNESIEGVGGKASVSGLGGPCGMD